MRRLPAKRHHGERTSACVGRPRCALGRGLNEEDGLLRGAGVPWVSNAACARWSPVCSLPRTLLFNTLCSAVALPPRSGPCRWRPLKPTCGALTRRGPLSHRPPSQLSASPGGSPPTAAMWPCGCIAAGSSLGMHCGRVELPCGIFTPGRSTYCLATVLPPTGAHTRLRLVPSHGLPEQAPALPLLSVGGCSLT